PRPSHGPLPASRRARGPQRYRGLRSRADRSLRRAPRGNRQPDENRRGEAQLPRGNDREARYRREGRSGHLCRRRLHGSFGAALLYRALKRRREAETRQQDDDHPQLAHLRGPADRSPAAVARARTRSGERREKAGSLDRAGEPSQFFVAERRRSDEALVKVAAPVPDQRELISRLNPFDDNLEAELAGEADQGPDHDPVAVAFDDMGDKTAIDLDRVERKSRQVIEARIARPQIVDRDPKSCVAQRRQPRRDAFAVGEERALGDLERHSGGVYCRGLDLLEQPMFVTRPADVRREKVDRYLEALERSLPDCRAAQRLALDEARKTFGKLCRMCPLEKTFGVPSDAGTRQRF